MDILDIGYGIGIGIVIGLGGYHFLTVRERQYVIDMLNTILTKIKP